MRSFSREEKARAFAYYEPLTVRDSSLSACTQAVIAAEVGHLDLAADYLAEAALMDLYDLASNGGDGLHIASLAGGWLAVVAGFGGMRDHGDHLLFRPQLPPGWTRLRFGVRWRGQRLHVELDEQTITYTVTGDEPVTITHATDDTSEEIELKPDEPARRPWEAVVPVTEHPSQPAGRAPYRSRRRAGDGSR